MKKHVLAISIMTAISTATMAATNVNLDNGSVMTIHQPEGAWYGEEAKWKYVTVPILGASDPNGPGGTWYVTMPPNGDPGYYVFNGPFVSNGSGNPNMFTITKPQNCSGDWKVEGVTIDPYLPSSTPNFDPANVSVVGGNNCNVVPPRDSKWHNWSCSVPSNTSVVFVLNMDAYNTGPSGGVYITTKPKVSCVTSSTGGGNPGGNPGGGNNNGGGGSSTGGNNPAPAPVTQGAPDGYIETGVHGGGGTGSNNPVALLLIGLVGIWFRAKKALLG